MNKIMNKNILYALLLIFAIGACTSDYEDTNSNPNNPEEAPYTNVFGYAIEELASLSGTTEMQYPGAFVGYTTKGVYTDVINYYNNPGATIWDGVYTDILTNANYAIEGAAEEGNVNLEAAAIVVKSYALQMITDIYGKVPYSEAGQAADGLIYPSFDEEKDIYADLLSALKEANEMFDEDDGGEIGAGDLIYDGDVASWKKLCNSLRLRMAIRMSEVDSDGAKEVIAAILGDSNTYPIFESNDDNAFITYPGDDWIEPWTSHHASIGDDYIAKPIVDTLLALNDPRIAYYADTISDGGYNGLTVGDESEGGEYSTLGDLFIENETGNLYFMKYAEIELIKAEAYLKGFIPGDAESAYNTAITASCEEYGIAASDISTYLTGSSVAYDGTLSQLYTQKWIALFRQCWEAWAEMRRTDVPALAPATNSTYSGHNRPPFRFPYPSDEVTNNGDNIPSSVSEDDLFWGYQVWWDTRSNVQ